MWRSRRVGRAEERADRGASRAAVGENEVEKGQRGEVERAGVRGGARGGRRLGGSDMLGGKNREKQSREGMLSLQALVFVQCQARLELLAQTERFASPRLRQRRDGKIVVHGTASRLCPSLTKNAGDRKGGRYLGTWPLCSSNKKVDHYTFTQK